MDAERSPEPGLVRVRTWTPRAHQPHLAHEVRLVTGVTLGAPR